MSMFPGLLHAAALRTAEGPTSRFRPWIEKVDDWQKCSVEHCPNDPESPANALDSNRSDFHNDKVCDPRQVSTIIKLEYVSW